MTHATAIRSVVDTPATQARHGPLRAGPIVPARGGAGVPACTSPKPKLLDQVRDAIRTRHYSYRTEEAYVEWIKRYITTVRFVMSQMARKALSHKGYRRV